MSNLSEEEIIKKAEYIIKNGQPYIGSMAEYFLELYNLYNKEKDLNNELQIRYKIEHEKYSKEKEKNKELERYKKYYQNERNLLDSYISKDKIRKKIKELEGQEDWYIENKSLDDLYGRIDELKELLEE